MKNQSTTILFLSLLLILVLAGCGSNGGTATGAVSTLAASQKCIICHSGSDPSVPTVSPVTGARYTDEWLQSAHNTSASANKTGTGAGCSDCHGPAHNHPNDYCGQCHGGSAPITATFINPDATRQCENCHGVSHPSDVLIVNSPQHFGNMTASANNTRFRASYVSSMYLGNCRKCHNPHDTSSGIAIAKQWAASGHGDVNAGARTSSDFKTRGTYLPVNTSFEGYCVRCHTTTGFVNFVTSGFTDQRPFAGPGYPVVKSPANSTDKTKEVTGCNACHDDGFGNAYGYKVRAVPPFKVYFNYSNATKVPPSVEITDTPVYYPDAGISNVCVPCHAGRGIGNMIKLADAKFLNFSAAPSSISSHDFPGASVVFKVGGYEYAGRNYANPSNFAHDHIGMNNFMNSGSSGPCVTCHMNSNASHSFAPVAFTPVITGTDPTAGSISSIVSNACATCHNSPATPAVTVQYLQSKRAGFQAAVTCLYALMSAKKVPGSPANWERLYGHGTGPNTMGASFNYNLLKADWGAYAHNDTYAKRLIYDSIDWLNNGIMDGDVEAAINSLTTATNPWKSTYTYTSAELAQLKVNAINYLLGAPGGIRP